MPSLRSQALFFVMRNRHLMQGRLHRETFDMSTSIADFRAMCEKGARRHATLPEGMELVVEHIDGINAEWLIPTGAADNRIVLYVHGGGYVSGSCNDHRGFVAKFAAACGKKTLQFEYRLAPENPFPDGLNDSVRVYEWLLANGYQSSNVVLAGESAGGGLALAMLLALKERDIAMPAATVAISPWTDLTCSSDSYCTKNNVSVAPPNSWLVFSKHYVGDNAADQPLISPLFGDLEGLPPLFINSGDADELYDDGEKFYLKAKDAGVDATFRAGKGMVHCYPLLAPMFPEATEAMNEICTFINRYIGEE